MWHHVLSTQFGVDDRLAKELIRLADTTTPRLYAATVASHVRTVRNQELRYSEVRTEEDARNHAVLCFWAEGKHETDQALERYSPCHLHHTRPPTLLEPILINN